MEKCELDLNMDSHRFKYIDNSRDISSIASDSFFIHDGKSELIIELYENALSLYKGLETKRDPNKSNFDFNFLNDCFEKKFIIPIDDTISMLFEYKESLKNDFKIFKDKLKIKFSDSLNINRKVDLNKEKEIETIQKNLKRDKQNIEDLKNNNNSFFSTYSNDQPYKLLQQYFQYNTILNDIISSVNCSDKLGDNESCNKIFDEFESLAGNSNLKSLVQDFCRDTKEKFHQIKNENSIISVNYHNKFACLLVNISEKSIKNDLNIKILDHLTIDKKDCKYVEHNDNEIVLYIDRMTLRDLNTYDINDLIRNELKNQIHNDVKSIVITTIEIINSEFDFYFTSPRIYNHSDNLKEIENILIINSFKENRKEINKILTILLSSLKLSSLQYSNKLTSLVLNNCGIRNENLFLILNLFKYHNIKTLGLSNNLLDDRSIIYFYLFFWNSKYNKPEFFNLSNNKISDESSIYLINLFDNLKGRIKIDLSGNNLTCAFLNELVIKYNKNSKKVPEIDIILFDIPFNYLTLKKLSDLHSNITIRVSSKLINKGDLNNLMKKNKLLLFN